MHELAVAREFEQTETWLKDGPPGETVWLNENAKVPRLLHALEVAGKKLYAGDTLLLTYAGHGTRIPDKCNQDSSEDVDTWCMYDRMLILHEAAARWREYRKGVRVIAVLDSCNSGTGEGGSLNWKPADGAASEPFVPGVVNAMLGGLRFPMPPGVRLMPDYVAERIYRAHQKVYDSRLEGTCPPANQGGRLDRSRSVPDAPGASVIVLMACSKGQVARELSDYGQFTQKLLTVWKDVWKKGAAGGSYRSFVNEIASYMPSDQQPQLFTLGRQDSQFEAEVPFTRWRQS
jgi:hypothetical protein